MSKPAVPRGYRRFAICCALAVASAASLPAPSFGGTEAAVGEARILAERVLGRVSEAVLFDERRLGSLVLEIGRALARIRERDSALAAIRIRQPAPPAVLLLGVEAHLFASINRLPEGGGVTDNEAFDTLNAKLGVRKEKVFPSLRVVALKTGDRVNVDAALKAYRAIDGVTFAEPDARLGDGSDIEAARSDGLWHVVFRRAWGDCPSGCINARSFFFVVDGGEVTWVAPRRARSMAAFSRLLARRGWR